jgi:hypothetical protein
MIKLITLSVAERMRQAAHLSSGAPCGIYMTKERLLNWAKELEPDHVPAEDCDPTIHAAMGRYESVGYVNRYGWLNYWFVSRDNADHNMWDGCYDRGYRPAHYPLPAVRPRIRVRVARVRVTLPGSGFQFVRRGGT